MMIDDMEEEQGSTATTTHFGGGSGDAAVVAAEEKPSSSGAVGLGMMMADDNTMLFHYSYLPTNRYYWYYFLQVFSATLSMIGSSLIIYLIYRHRNQRWEVYHRLLLALSIADIFFDLSIIWQFPMVRSDTNHPLALGNITSCSAIGFATTWTFSTVNLFFVVLSIYFVLTVRYGYNERQVQRYMEPYGYIFAIGLPLVICTAAVSTAAFNPVRLIPTCFMRPYPTNCYDDENTVCIRGGNARPVVYLFKGTAFITMVIGIVCTWLVYWTVRNQHRRQRQYSYSGSSHAIHVQQRHRQRLRTVSRQAIWFTCVFLNGIFASMFSSRLEAAVAGGVIPGGAPSNETLADHIVLAVFVSLYLFLCPLQGLFNVIIYLRPSFLLWRDAHPNKGRIWAVRQILHGKKVTVTRRRSHLVDGNVNEDTKCHDDTTTPTFRTYDDSRSQGGLRCSGNSSSRRTDGSLAMLDRWKLEDDNDDEKDPQNQDTTEENHDTTEENHEDNDDLETPRPPPSSLLETAATAAPPDDDNDNDNHGDVVINVIGRQHQQQRQEGGPSLQSAEMASSPLSPRRDSHGLRVSFADDHAEQQSSQNDGLRGSFTDGPPLPSDDVRPPNGLRVSFSDEQPPQSDDEAKQQQRLHAPEDIGPRRQQQQQQEPEQPQDNNNDAEPRAADATAAASVVGASVNDVVSDREDG